MGTVKQLKEFNLPGLQEGNEVVRNETEGVCKSQIIVAGGQGDFISHVKELELHCKGNEKTFYGFKQGRDMVKIMFWKNHSRCPMEN